MIGPTPETPPQQGYMVPTYRKRGRAEAQIGSRELKMTDEMQRLTDLVANMGKDIKTVRNAMCLETAQDYAARKGEGWTAHKQDIAGCPEPEVFITNPRGELYSINGYRLAPSKYLERRITSQFNYGKPRNERMTQKQVVDEMNRFVLNPDTNNWDYDDSRIPPDFLPYVNRNRAGKYQTPKRLFKQIFFDDLKEAFFAQIQGHDRIDTRTKAVINNAALAAMYKELIVNEGFRINNVDPNDITTVNKWKKTPEFTNILLGLLTQIHNYNHDEADGLVNAAAQIYQEVANRVLTNQETAVQQREIRSQQRNELYERRIGEMR